MAGCIMAAGVRLSLEAAAFTLSWEHSVEHVLWRENWTVGDEGLTLVKAAVKGSGAGMEPGEGARLTEGWWVWTPDKAPVRRLVLAASGATASGWTLCSGKDCRRIGNEPADPMVIEPCS